ncbi:MAG: hypothetical protein ABIW32_08180 [Terrimesophilobacter sp.]
MTVIVGYDLITLREKVDLLAAEERLRELEGRRDMESLNERVGLLRLTGRLDAAWDAANESLRNVRFSGDREQLCLARIRRAQVQQFQGKLDAALIELTACVDEARNHDWAPTEAFALQHRGKVLFDQREYAAALSDFRTAATIRTRIGAAEEQIQSSLVAVAVAESYLTEENPTGE